MGREGRAAFMSGAIEGVLLGGGSGTTGGRYLLRSDEIIRSYAQYSPYLLCSLSRRLTTKYGCAAVMGCAVIASLEEILTAMGDEVKLEASLNIGQIVNN